MIKIAHGLAAMALGAGLVLGTAGAALASPDMSGIPGHALMSTPISKLSVGQLESLKGQALYDRQGTLIGKIKRLTRSEDSHRLYFVVGAKNFLNDGLGNAAVAVNQLKWRGKTIVLAQELRPLPISQGRASTMDLKAFAYVGNPESPSAI